MPLTQTGTAGQPAGLKIASCGVALLLIGVGLASQFGPAPQNATVAADEWQTIVPLIPAIAGALLTFWGAIRVSLVVRPLFLAAAGFILEIVPVFVPLAFTQVFLFPEMNTDHWNAPSLFFIVLRLVGLLFLSAAGLRLLIQTSDRT
jgi:hypothetical protein